MRRSVCAVSPHVERQTCLCAFLWVNFLNRIQFARAWTPSRVQVIYLCPTFLSLCTVTAGKGEQPLVLFCAATCWQGKQRTSHHEHTDTKTTFRPFTLGFVSLFFHRAHRFVRVPVLVLSSVLKPDREATNLSFETLLQYLHPEIFSQIQLVWICRRYAMERRSTSRQGRPI